jgi:hypothetical protein
MAEAGATNLTVIREVDSGSSFEIWRGPKEGALGKAPAGVMRVDWTRRGVVRVIMVGHGHSEFAGIINRRLETNSRPANRFITMGDFWDLETYDSGFRVEQAAWIKKHETKWDGSHVLVRSKLVAMGITVANLALGGKIKVYAQRSEFDRACTGFGLPLNPAMPK